MLRFLFYAQMNRWLTHFNWPPDGRARSAEACPLVQFRSPWRLCRLGILNASERSESQSSQSDHISTMVLIRNHRAFSILIDIYIAI